MTFCGREWCEVCREPMHGRRESRWLPKVQELESMGYLVVTLPPEDRPRFRTQESLSEAGKRATAVVRGTWARGLRRWHWFGETGQDYHPHLNFLVDGGHVSRALLRGLRRELARALGLSRPPVLHYQFSRRPGQMWHDLKYVTRATFLARAWDDELADELHGFRNAAWWGKWGGPPVWTLEDLGGQAQDDVGLAPGEIAAVGKLEEGTCPLDGSRVTWGRALPIRWLPAGVLDMGAGYSMATPGPGT